MSHSLSRPVFARCVRCEYSLRGLPANHACPECGLRFDEDCGLYRVTNPKSAFFILLLFSGSWLFMLKGLRHLGHWMTASVWQKLHLLSGVVWIIFIVVLTWKLYKIYRRGQSVAVTTDGLIIHMVGFKEELLPWTDLAEASVKPQPEKKPQIATLKLKKEDKSIQIGGVYNVFPTKDHVERFVAQVNGRIAGASESAAADA